MKRFHLDVVHKVINRSRKFVVVRSREQDPRVTRTWIHHTQLHGMRIEASTKDIFKHGIVPIAIQNQILNLKMFNIQIHIKECRFIGQRAKHQGSERKEAVWGQTELIQRWGLISSAVLHKNLKNQEQLLGAVRLQSTIEPYFNLANSTQATALLLRKLMTFLAIIAVLAMLRFLMPIPSLDLPSVAMFQLTRGTPLRLPLPCQRKFFASLVIESKMVSGMG